MPNFQPPFTINNGDTASASYLTNMVQVSAYCSSAMVILGNGTSGTNVLFGEMAIGSNLVATATSIAVSLTPTFTNLGVTGYSVFGGTASAFSTNILNVFAGSVSAGGGQAILVSLGGTLNATATSDILYQSTFGEGTVNLNGQTGVSYSGISIYAPGSVVSGTLANAYQLYINPPPSATHAYAIYSQSGTNYFGGAMEFGTFNTGAVTATGFINVTTVDGVVRKIAVQ
jgi:hypothetical protein